MTTCHRNAVIYNSPAVIWGEKQDCPEPEAPGASETAPKPSIGRACTEPASGGVVGGRIRAGRRVGWGGVELIRAVRIRRTWPFVWSSSAEGGSGAGTSPGA